MQKLLTIVIILFSCAALAKSEAKTPYYASIKADEANVRTGPSIRYPIQWVYKRENWPVEVTATFEGWRKIRDIQGEAGWIHESLLTGRRNTIIQTEGVEEVFRLPIKTSVKVLIVENGVIAELLSCKSDWCKIKASGEKGWIQAKYLWGVDEGEVF